MYVCMYVCMCTHLEHLLTCLFVCLSACLPLSLSLSVRLSVWFFCLFVCFCVCVCKYAHTHIHAYVICTCVVYGIRGQCPSLGFLLHHCNIDGGRHGGGGVQKHGPCLEDPSCRRPSFQKIKWIVCRMIGKSTRRIWTGKNVRQCGLSR